MQAACCQWLRPPNGFWIGRDGVKAFSDRPPPADIADKNILRRPGAAPLLLLTPLPAPAAPASAAASAPAASGVDRALADRKRKAEEAEQAQRKEVEEKNQLAKADNCVRARQAKASYESGMRIQRVNEKGEVEVLDAAARAAEVQRVQSIIEVDCAQSGQ